jgi:hypothetical protein
MSEWDELIFSPADVEFNRKASLIVDVDGSFFGSKSNWTTAIPFAELRFDSKRVPREALTNMDGSRISIRSIMNKGP